MSLLQHDQLSQTQLSLLLLLFLLLLLLFFIVSVIIIIVINGCDGFVGGRQPQVPCSCDAEEDRLVGLPE